MGASPVVTPPLPTRECDAGNRFAQVTDAIALAVALALFVSKGLAISERLIGVQNRSILVIFAVVWLTSAASRLLEFWRGKTFALAAHAKGARTVTALIAGTGSWYVLFFSRKLYPESLIWTPASLPLWVNVIGIALALAAVIRPPVRTTAGQTDTPNALIPQLTVRTEILMIAMLLITGSLVIVLMVGLWLVLLLGVPSNPFQTDPFQAARHNPSSFAVRRLRLQME